MRIQIIQSIIDKIRRKKYTKIVKNKTQNIIVYDDFGNEYSINYHPKIIINSKSPKNSNNIIKIHKDINLEGIVFINFENDTVKNTTIIMDSITLRKSMSININSANCKLYIGKNTHIGSIEFYLREENASIDIDSESMFSFNIEIWAGDGHTIYDLDSKEALNTFTSPIKIGKHCWVCKEVIMTKNASIPDNSVIGIRALVTKNFIEQNTVISGIPAKIVKRNINWSPLQCYQYQKIKNNV